jgi:hypothetical protein
MSELYEILFKIAVAIAGFLGGWVLNRVTASVDHLQRADSELATKVNAIELLVAGQYVRRDDFDKISSEMFRKLDKIYDKLDGKADKV